MPIDPFALVSPPLFTSADIRRIDRAWATVHPEQSLMARAGLAAASLAHEVAADLGGAVLVLAGPGNNGGDALVAARHLKAQGMHVVVVSRADPAGLPHDAQNAWAAWHACGGTVVRDIPADPAFSLVIDGLFGVGLTRGIAGEEARWIERVNALPCPRLALDVPSGLDADSGAVRGAAVRANHTLTFLGLKPGLLTGRGRDVAGTLHLDPLGLDASTLPATSGITLTGLEARHRLPVRSYDSHKGDYGRVGLVGGAPGMVGACLIAGRAALGEGAGVVTLGVIDERVVVDYGEPRLMFAAPETLLAAPLTVLAIGPGLGQTAHARALLDAALAAPCPLVLDADALNLLASEPELLQRVAVRTAPTVLTPHPGEAARLLIAKTSEIQNDRIEAARHLSLLCHATVALKGSGTIVAHPDGRYSINTSGGPWLAQAGSGDRLTGMITARIGQGLTPAEAVESAVWLHGVNADQQARDFR